MSDFMIRSYMPGRLRFRHPDLKGLDVEACQGMAFFIESIEGVTGCTINPRVGSVLLTWNPEQVSLEELVANCPMVADMPEMETLMAEPELTLCQKVAHGASRGLGCGIVALTGDTPNEWRTKQAVNRLALAAFSLTLLALPVKSKMLHVVGGVLMSTLIGGHLLQHKKYL